MVFFIGFFNHQIPSNDLGHPVFVLPFNYGVGFFLENDAKDSSDSYHIIALCLGKLNAIPAIPQN